MESKTIKECDIHPGEVIVEWIHPDGTIDMVRFSGPNAWQAATTYYRYQLNDNNLGPAYPVGGRLG